VEAWKMWRVWTTPILFVSIIFFRKNKAPDPPYLPYPPLLIRGVIKNKERTSVEWA
jgi:hypothetical protein